MLLWLLCGVAALAAVIVLVIRSQPTTLGPYSLRLLVLALALGAYYGAGPWFHHLPDLIHPVRGSFLRYLVPVAGCLGLLYCAWRIVENWHSEMRGLVRAVLKLLAAVVLAVVARICLSR